MNYLDCGRTEAGNMAEKLEEAQKNGQSSNIDTKFFTVTVYKKGTCHLTFKDMDLLKKFNLYCGRKQNWIPDNYGQKPYKDLSDEEKAIVDSFEGEKSYQQTYEQKEFFLPRASGLLMLGSSAA